MRVIVLILLFVFSLYSKIEPIKSDFKACYNKNKTSFVKIKKSNAIAVSKHRAILFSKRYIRGYIKRDPFLGLYLFKSKKALKAVEFADFSKVKKSVAVVGKYGYKTANILSFSNSLDAMTKLNKKVKSNMLVECVCCRAFGITKGGDSFIDSDFILRFLKKKRVVYADAGLKFIQKGSKIFIKEKNPFFKGLYIKKGDQIVKIDGKSYTDVSSLSKYLLFSKVGKVVNITYKRGGKFFTQKIKLKKLKAGGLIPQTYLESIGLWVGRSLRVYGVEKNSLAHKLGLKKGDILMKIGKNYIHSYKEIKKALFDLKDKAVYMLFSRDDFQFFVHFRR